MPFKTLFFLLRQYPIDCRWNALTSWASYVKWVTEFMG